MSLATAGEALEYSAGLVTTAHPGYRAPENLRCLGCLTAAEQWALEMALEGSGLEDPPGCAG